jgi:hypothetical protein
LAEFALAGHPVENVARLTNVFPMRQTLLKLQEGDWIRFQVPDKRVLEGFIQEVAEGDGRLLIGKAPDWPENEWYRLTDIEIIKHQEGKAFE